MTCTDLEQEGLIEHDICYGCHGDWDSGYDMPLDWELVDGRTVGLCCGAKQELEQKGMIVE